MSAFATPYGLKPVQLIGGEAFNGGVAREFPVRANNTAAIYNGDLIQLSTAGLPSAVSTSPTAVKIPATSADATAGIVGVCVGVRYVTAGTKQPVWSQYLPANATTAGLTDIWIMVSDDPNTVFQVKGTAALGTFNSGTNGSGWPGAIGKNAALDFSTAGSTSTGVSGVALSVGTNGGNLATTATLATRIIGIVPGTESDAYPEFYVKLNVGVHSYTNSLGV